MDSWRQIEFRQLIQEKIRHLEPCQVSGIKCEVRWLALILNSLRFLPLAIFTYEKQKTQKHKTIPTHSWKMSQLIYPMYRSQLTILSLKTVMKSNVLLYHDGFFEYIDFDDERIVYTPFLQKIYFTYRINIRIIRLKDLGIRQA